MNRANCINLLKNCRETLRQKYGITSLRLFGSMAREQQGEDSDVDLFVDTQTPNPFVLMDAKEFLEQELHTSVDIVRNHKNLNQRLMRRIQRDGILIF